MKQPKDTPDEQQIANDISARLPAAGSLADRMMALQEAADKIGLVDPSFNQKSFFDVL
ncbi:hypothetical protein CLV80_1022 [Yoonia maritima]|uniref:Uncharacterized protein n=1 Tax=Yoonia maritima TaxID=1435347 RepID=A0A2T0W2F3_9RHOB|nr:hypothetical protein [Yoonia maritima]PRY79360.1 hypothetical protein CLV80_1022 [Yoonia maritima]